MKKKLYICSTKKPANTLSFAQNITYLDSFHTFPFFRKSNTQDMKKEKLLAKRLALGGLLLLALCCSCSVQQALNKKGDATVARVPDENFRSFLVEQGLAQPYSGTDKALAGNKEVLESTKMGRALQVMNCTNKDIKSMEGIELFPELKILICSDNPLQTIDLSRNPQLVRFTAAEVPLRSLDVSHNPELKMIEVSYSDISKLDLSHNPKLDYLYCIFSPRIKELDLSQNPMLQTLFIRETNIQILDLRKNLDIRNIHTMDTPLQYIIVTPQHNQDSISGMIEDDVKVLTLGDKDALPKIKRPTLFQRLHNKKIKREEERRPKKQIVMSTKKAIEMGINIDSLWTVYPHAWQYNKETGTYDSTGIVFNEEEMVMFEASFREFVSGIASAMREKKFDWDTTYRWHLNAFFSENGYVELLNHNFVGKEPAPKQVEQFEKILKAYIRKTPFTYTRGQKFGQCGTLTFK